MPAVHFGKVLVTGASGYLGAWVVKYLVERSYSVVVALRSQAQVDFVTRRFPEYEGKVTGVVISDITMPGAYDRVVEDVDAIIHSASPVAFAWQDPSEIIEPAVKGATGILTSAAKFGKNIQRVILTSSVSAIGAGDRKKGEAYGETLWNQSSVETVEQEGRKSGVWTVYAASKTLAERAAWDFVANEKPAFDLTTINPSFNFGPYLHEAPKDKGPGSSPEIFLSTLPSGDLSGKRVGGWVDVRDVALQHILALSTPEAGGERIISTADSFTWHDLYDVLNDAGFSKIPGKDTYGKGENAEKTPGASNAKSLKIFPGFKYRALSESVREMGQDLVKGGFL